MYSIFKKTDTKKHVSFAENVKTADGSSSVKTEKPPRYSLIRKKWLEYASQNNYEALSDYLKSCKQKGVVLKDFFSQEGYLILNYGLTQSNIKFLEFLDSTISHDLIKDILTQYNFILNGFLRTQSGLESLGWITSESQKDRMDKFELLFKWGMQDLLKTCIENKKSIPESLIADFETTWGKYNDETKSTTSEESLTI